MEKWESLIDSYPSSPDLKHFMDVINVSHIILKQDLAQFETEWFIETLLFKPVELLSTMASERNNDAWGKVLMDSFKVLMEIVTKYPENCERHLENIVKVCEMPYKCHTQKYALHCLVSICKWCVPLDVARYVSALAHEEANACKAPLALLVGAICEHHPENVADHATTIWRHFLNMLGCNKNTELVTNGVLNGIYGLLKNFGNDLPTMELSAFYKSLTNKFISMQKHETVCFKILEKYADLFPPLAKDSGLRSFLYNALFNGSGGDVLQAIYKIISDRMTKQEIEEIVKNELVNLANSKNIQVRYTTLKIIAYLEERHGTFGVSLSRIDAQKLEFELRSGDITFHSAETILWCIETNQNDCDKLLQTAILFEENLPRAKRKEIVIYGILKAASEVRKATLIFLVTETCKDIGSYISIWRRLFDMEDIVVQQKCRATFEDFMEYLDFCLQLYEEQQTPDMLPSFLQLTSHVLPLLPNEDYVSEYCSLCLPKVTRYAKKAMATRIKNDESPPANGAQLSNASSIASAIAAGRSMCTFLEENECSDFYKIIKIDKCRDEATLVEYCIALIQANDVAVNAQDVLNALQIIFSRNDVEASMLSQALKRFDQLLFHRRNILDANIVNDVIWRIDKMLTREDKSDKSGRILRRDVVLFLGKYGVDLTNDDQENIVIVKLRNVLVLELPNTSQFSTYKLNLNRLLQLAIAHENPKVLQTMITILFAHLATNSDSNIQYALTLVLRATCRLNSRGDYVPPSWVQQAICLCDNVPCLNGIIEYLKSEKSPGVRKMMSNALEGMLLKNAGLVTSELLIRTTAQYSSVMMRGTDATSRRAGLDLIETVTAAIKDNNKLSVELLPDLIVLIPKTGEVDSGLAFDHASKLFLVKHQLFKRIQVERILSDLMRDLLIDETRKDFDLSTIHDAVMAFRNSTEYVLEFIKKIGDLKAISHVNILEIFSKILSEEDALNNSKILHVLTEMQTVYDFDIVTNEKVVNLKDILEYLFYLDCKECHRFDLEGILKFITNYAAVLLEHQEIMELLNKLILNTKPDDVVGLQKQINNCILTYNRIWKTTPKMVLLNFESWCSSLRLNEITRNIERKEFHQEDSLQVNSLKIYLEAFNLNDISYILTDVKEYIKTWPKVLLKLYSTGYIEKYLKSKMSYLTDLLTVSLMFLTKTEIKSLILEGIGVGMGDIGIRFCRYFLNVFIDYLLRSPFAMTDADMAPCCVLLNDIAKYVALRKFNENLCKNTLELIDSLWPKYEVETNFTQKYKLLLDISSLKLKLSSESNPLKWVVRTIDCPQTSRENVMRLIGVLPGGEAFSSIRKFACHVPVRLSESGECLRAILDALAANGDFTLLDILAALCSGDQSKGTWDTAIDSCMASLAIKNDMKIYSAVYTRCWHNLSTGVCDRMMVPLLRYSTSAFCERFFSYHVGDLLSKLRKTHKEASAHYAYQKCLTDHVKAFTILQIAFEKIPSSLESPNSLLYKNVNAKQSWHLVREVCKLCCTLRGTISCDYGADEKIKELHRLFHKRNYKCLCAAICRRRPDSETFYGYIFNRDVWTKIVDLDKKYKLPIRNQWHARTIRESVSLEVPAMRSSASTTHTRTVRTRLFLRTLSENPLQYDLMPNADAETVVTQDLQLIENELNQEEMTATLSALFCHAASLPHTAWLKELTEFLSGDYPVNSKWILAQAICNCKDELKSHTSPLYPALLAVIANSITELCGKQLLNGLHVEILNTLTQWRDKERMLLQKSRNDLNTIAYSLVVTAVEYRGRQYAYKSLMDILEVFVNDFKEVLSLEWSLVNQLFKDIRNDFPKTGSKLIQSLIKDRESLINDVMEVIQTNVQNKCWSDVSKLAELLGNAIGCTENETIKISALEKYRLLLEKVRKTSEIEYMKMLYYSQQGYKGFCDENSLRHITNLVQKLSSHNKTKCLLIISSYISQLNATTENVSDMFDMIDFTDIIGDYTKETLQVIRDGVMVMDRIVKRRLVMATVEYCDHPDVKVRRLAFEVMLKALDDAFQKKTIQPSATKRPKYEYASSLLKVLKFEDTYKKKLLTALGSGVSDVDDEISGLVREGVCRHLCTDNMAIRFAECFLLTVYLPTTSSKQCLDLSVSLSALLYLFFGDLRSREAFKNIKLRNEPVRPNVEHSVVSSKLLTMSSTYRGTFRTYTGRIRINVDRQDESNAINVEISIDYILDTLLQFSKDNSEAAQTLCIEVLKCLLSDTRPDSFDTVMVEQLTCVLESGGEFTPLAIQMARLFIKFVKDCEIDRFKFILPKLTEICKNTEGESIVRVLSEDVTLRDHSLNMFSMGRINEDVTDVPMSDLEAFDFNEMLSAFDKLSDWESLTIQERNIVEDMLPRLWTDSVDNFVMETPFEAKHSWLEKMLQVLKDENKQDSFKWLRDMKKWPRSRFYNSAVTEAIQWQSGLSINLEDLKDLPGVSKEDCLVKWAARFLVRQTYFQSLSHDDDTLCQDVLLLSRSHELRWTKRANEMALPNQALECIRKNIRHLTLNEQLQWMNQKVTTLRLLGLKQKNNNILKEALEIAEETRVEFAKKLNPDIVEINLQVLLLKNDLQDTSPETLRNIKLHVEKLTDDKTKKMSSNTKSALKSLYEVMMSNYDELWDKCEDSSSQSDVLSNMADVLGHVTQAVTSRHMFVDIVLDKLDQYEGETLPDDVANNILDKLQHENLDDFAIEQIKKHRNLFSNKVLSSYVSIWDRVSSGDTSKYKQCLQLIADASHLLAQYCESLEKLLKNQEREKEWEDIFRRIRKSIFENPYAGSDYQLLEDYKNNLYSIEKYDSTEEFKNKAMTILRNTYGVLSTQAPKRILLLSQLCPELIQYDSESNNELERLLGLKGLKVIRFDEQVSVFTDSVRRPTVFHVLVSDGKWRRYLVKSGEPLKVDASAQRVRVAITHCGYTVTPLADDCGIIEYLEDHVRIRDIIKSATPSHLLSDVLESSIKPNEDEIILTPAQVLRLKYEDNCSKIPAHYLRSSIEEKCCSIQDFIMKKHKFENTLVQMTLISSLLGLGDRHLQNIMYSEKDGGVSCVDWAAIFNYGVEELPAARLTRNFIAVCNTQALESGLQNSVTMLRKSYRLFAASISMSFKWMGQEFKEKEPHIRKFLNGETASHVITKDVLLKSTKKYKDKYLQLLEEIFDDYEGVQFYSVIDQVSSLLRMSTDLRVLAVTRPPWEPWI